MSISRCAWFISTVALLAGCQTPPTTSPAEVGEIRAGSGYLKGYLDRKLLPDSLALLPRPPAAGSAQWNVDLEAHKAARSLRGTPRWQLATQDADLKFPAAAQRFSCALGVPISAEGTPHLNMMLRRLLADSGLSTYRAKDSYNRKRPFVELSESTCTPAEETALAKDGSYPSGHSALGWTWGLALAELAPERADALLQRAYAFGQSRVICGVHWQSDVDMGRVMGAAALSRVRSDPVFQAQAERARSEIQAARAQGLQPRGDCAAEAAALANVAR